jgi:hypothetical protein
MPQNGGLVAGHNFSRLFECLDLFVVRNSQRRNAATSHNWPGSAGLNRPGGVLHTRLNISATLVCCVSVSPTYNGRRTRRSDKLSVTTIEPCARPYRFPPAEEWSGT